MSHGISSQTLAHKDDRESDLTLVAGGCFSVCSRWIRSVLILPTCLLMWPGLFTGPNTEDHLYSGICERYLPYLPAIPACDNSGCTNLEHVAEGH